MSGPSATAKPMSAKIAVSSSTTWLIGWMRPISAADSRTGSVTSTVSVLSRALSVWSFSASRRAAMAAVTRSFSPLMSGPCCLRSSGDIVPSVLSSADTEPLLPSAATRTASSAASSDAPFISARICCSSCAMSDMVFARLPGHCERSEAISCAGRDCFVALRAPRNDESQKRSGRERGLGLLDDRLEGGRLADGEIGQHLAVDRDPGLGDAGDEPAVGQAEIAHRRVEALDPQRPEGALAPLAVAERVLVGLLHRLLGDPDGVLAPAVIALGGFEDLLVLGVRGDAPFDPGHGSTP